MSLYDVSGKFGFVYSLRFSSKVFAQCFAIVASYLFSVRIVFHLSSDRKKIFLTENIPPCSVGELSAAFSLNVKSSWLPKTELFFFFCI